jgi:hypothetical protein
MVGLHQLDECQLLACAQALQEHSIGWIFNIVGHPGSAALNVAFAM